MLARPLFREKHNPDMSEGEALELIREALKVCTQLLHLLRPRCNASRAADDAQACVVYDLPSMQISCQRYVVRITYSISCLGYPLHADLKQLYATAPADLWILQLCPEATKCIAVPI